MKAGKGVIPLSYYTGVPNVGDLANADLVSAVGGVSTYQTRDVHLPHLLAVGSVMEWAQPSSIIWGTGVMDPAKGIGGAVSQNIFALRGALSMACLRDHGVTPDVPLGDPAFLLPELLHVARKSVVGKIGIVPHYVDQKNAFFQKLIRQGAQMLDVTTLKVPAFLEEMATCEFVISSSLHGLIFAEALNIANLWVETGDGVHGGGFKFRDWFSTMGNPQREAYRPQGAVDLSSIVRMCETHDFIIDKADLAAAFPKSLLIAESPLDTSHLVTVDMCRNASIHLFVDASTGLDRAGLEVTVNSALAQLNQPRFIVVGPHAHVARDLDLAHEAVTYFPEYEDGVDAAFMKCFFDKWAEPQKHVIVEAGFDFSGIDVAEELDGALLRQPHLEAIIMDRAGRRIVYRRPGRWW